MKSDPTFPVPLLHSKTCDTASAYSCLCGLISFLVQFDHVSTVPFNSLNCIFRSASSSRFNQQRLFRCCLYAMARKLSIPPACLLLHFPVISAVTLQQFPFLKVHVGVCYLRYAIVYTRIYVSLSPMFSFNVLSAFLLGVVSHSDLVCPCSYLRRGAEV